ncbi:MULTISPECIES: universal stress protein [Actinomadura]|uniref:Universal stress protein n=1 Tax=Actinomadura litoris TaxID=2678616 RepID=A0A7K1L004_9ACTN|nr:MULTISPECIES: universal stress protein [Actinomadura]MBT2211737.1 universal stress protein [Actinomadura sp. NEAU-AAG7]MUN37768.1 universal stress protein [Actinomadura litoris]
MSDRDGMRVLVGYAPDDRGDDALALGARFVRAAEGSLTVANIHPPAWPARGPGSVDAEWVSYLRERSDAALDQALDHLYPLSLRDGVTRRVHAHRGSGRGLIEVARDTGAGLIVIGSAPRGRRGRIAIGSTADQLLHGSPVPVLLAPRGYAEEAPPRFERLTIAYWRHRDAGGPLASAAGFARVLGLPIRLLTLVLRPPGLAARFRGADELMARQLAQAEEGLAQAAALFTDDPDGQGGGSGAGGSGGLGKAAVETEAVVGTGVAAALGSCDMLPGEVLACLSSNDGPLRKVFLGEGSGKIVRAAPCPVLVLPRGAVPSLPSEPQG